MNFRLIAKASLGLGGIVLKGMGAYFALLRPPFLPEDIRYIGISVTELQSTIPRFLLWISRVFGVLGGYMFATGLLTTALAASSFRNGKPLPTAIVVISGLASIGWMATTNFLIDSDFKRLLLAFTMPWLIAIMSSLAPDVRDSKART